ncbi:hypothetical protein, conserved [Eimeria necatrix]|uniref:Transmembrane protein n=1 Tax=Eimeria necatrix TaxID=51315 RepID=U6N2E1_9EIME|nr:hypothetical protein, conserved [Eimeria necatrix]CDJ68085.1 hypothetical protein, conserved [Eimeria necatrix]
MFSPPARGVVAAGAVGGSFLCLPLSKALAVNLGGAGLMATMLEEDVCIWYWINIMVDTTLGVYVQYMLLRGARRLFKGAKCLEYGSYGSPPRWSACLSQALSWQAFCLFMKIFASAFMLALQEPLGKLGNGSCSSSSCINSNSSSSSCSRSTCSSCSSSSCSNSSSSSSCCCSSSSSSCCCSSSSSSRNDRKPSAFETSGVVCAHG